MPRPDRASLHAQNGTALIAALTTVTLLAALGGGLLLTVMSEVRIAALHREGLQVLYAGDGMIELLIAELAGREDITAALEGASTSAFVDGPADERRIGDRTIHLAALTHVERCGKPDPCDAAAVAGTNVPWWQLYAHGWMHDMVGEDTPPLYLVAWIGDDPYENDGDAARDGLAGLNPGHGVVALRVHAYGVSARRRIEVIVGGLPDRPRLLSWTEPDL